MTLAHYIPFRAIRAGKDLSDSKGSSAAISTEAAVLSMRRAMAGFQGPKDMFRNPECIFRFFEPTTGGTASNKDQIDITLSNKKRWGPGDSPFDLALSHSGSDFAVCGMHFKLGLYEHQSAGALQGVVNAVLQNPDLVAGGLDGIKKISIKCYEPAFGIIGDPAKMNPQTRQSADHSMAFIVSRKLLKAFQAGSGALADNEAAWKALMLSPYDYGHEALFDKQTRALMGKIQFVHGGAEYDSKYPEGIPTSIDIELTSGKTVESGFVMFPSGHAAWGHENQGSLAGILKHKASLLGGLALEADELGKFHQRLLSMKDISAKDVQSVYSFDYSKLVHHPPIDG
jgi:2-methylcitrate dehydratase